MCGIWAVFGIPHFSQYISHAMNIACRGPDGFRMETLPPFQNCCLAFHRLAIVGDIDSMQPMRVKNFPHLYLIYNGEIYNHKDVGDKYGFDVETLCDGEIILHLYNKFGAEKTAQLLDGVFAFCILDTAKKQVHLGRDTFGIRPMFTMTGTEESDKNMLALSSEVKSLVPIVEHMASEGHKMELGVFPPGHFASYSLDPDGFVTLIEKGPYTFVGKRPVFNTRVQPVSSNVKENIRMLFTEAVRKRLMADRRIGCFLSGGLDSSLVAAVLMKVVKEAGISYPIQTFSIGMKGSEDVLAARKVAAHIGSEHHEIAFTAEDVTQSLHDVIYSLESYDPGIMQASVALYLLSKYIREQTDTVVLYSGEGADELCQGYKHFSKAPSAEEADKESRRQLQMLYAFDVLRSDRCTAAHGLETRVPFLDVDFTSYFLSLPGKLRQSRDGIEKWLLRSAFDVDDLLPKTILWRPKMCFGHGASNPDPGRSMLDELTICAASHVTDSDLARAGEVYPVNTPTSKDGFFYRQIFEASFPGHGKVIPHLWRPPTWITAADPLKYIY